MSRGLLLVGHGSHLNADSSAPVRQHAAAIREMGVFDEVRMGFWKEEPGLSRALDPFEASDITVVPVFISAGYFTNEVIPREMGLTGEVTEVRGKRVRYTPPIGSHPALARVILQRAREAGGQPGDTLAVLGHGTPRNPDSERNVYAQAENARRLGGFREVITVFLDQEPNMRDIFALTAAETVVIVPLFIADDWHVGETIPEDLALDGPETRREGRRLRYAGSVGTHPSVVEVILELAGSGTRPSTNGHSGRTAPRRYELLELDRLAPGEATNFWQFTVRREEHGFILGPLAQHGDPAQGEEIPLAVVPERCRYDDHGRYRPLSSALTMPTGWYARFDCRQQLEALLEDIYPLATVHSLQSAQSELRVVGLDEVLERQSGRYAVAASLSHEGRVAARAALCERRCDRVPIWAASPPSGGDRSATWPAETAPGGSVPCPEPCSVFVSLCREAALWEQEPPRPAEVDPSVGRAAFEEPGNEVREEYLALRYGDRVGRDG